MNIINFEETIIHIISQNSKRIFNLLGLAQDFLFPESVVSVTFFFKQCKNVLHVSKFFQMGINLSK